MNVPLHIFQTICSSQSNRIDIKMGLRRPGTTKEYEEMPGVNVPVTETDDGRSNHTRSSTISDQVNRRDFELTSATVSVVPDGKHIYQ